MSQMLKLHLHRADVPDLRSSLRLSTGLAIGQMRAASEIVLESWYY